MDSDMIVIARTEHDGRAYAIRHGLDPSNVVVADRLDTLRGQRPLRYIVVPGTDMTLAERAQLQLIMRDATQHFDYDEFERSMDTREEFEEFSTMLRGGLVARA